MYKNYAKSISFYANLNFIYPHTFSVISGFIHLRQQNKILINMNRIIYIVACLMFFACTGKNNKTNSSYNSPEYTITESADVNLSSFNTDEDGFIVLFDGQTTAGWRGYGKNYLPNKWEVTTNCLILNQKGKEGGDIIFNYKFRNFELKLEWKVSKAGNSGIFYLAREVKSKDPVSGEYKLQSIFISAPEYQILDNDNHPDAKLGKNGNRKAGSLYDMIAAEPQTAKPYGEWNRTRIIVDNGIVTHWLNDIKVVEYSFKGQQWIDLLQSGKFGQTKWPLAFELMKDCGGKNHEGYIGLQDHGDNVSFRNIRIKLIN